MEIRKWKAIYTIENGKWRRVGMALVEADGSLRVAFDAGGAVMDSARQPAPMEQVV